MCYSAMVQQDAQKLGLRFQARVQYDDYVELFERRLNGEKMSIGKGLEAPFLKDEKTPKAKKIAAMIEKWHASRITALESEIFKQKERKANAERSLKTKTTKKAQEDLRISANKIEKCLADLKRHKSSTKLSESDDRIFPIHYFSALALDQKGEKIIRPFRYLMRPHDKDESFDRDYGGCYNARLDNLKRVAFWKDSLSQRRGLIVIRRFFENVPVGRYREKNQLPKELIDRDNIVLCFEPENVEFMFVPILWDVWKKKGQPDLYSAALITDDPAPEIQAAGHDRTPIFLKESAIESWLEAKTVEEALSALAHREKPFYHHRVLGIAS